MKQILTLILILISTNLFSQSSINGRVLDSKTKEPIIGASVYTSRSGSTTDLKGFFEIKIDSSTKLLNISYVSYRKKSISLDTVKSGFIILLDEEPMSLGQVTVTAKVNRESTSSLIIQQKKLSVVSDAISSETIKKTPDRTVGDVLKRVTGVTIQSDKFVTVRGLSDRYNLVILNNSPLPSTEPDRRSFSFDVIPSSLIDNLIIIKSPIASLPGDFSGGIIQINTKLSDSKFNNVGLSLSYGSLTTFNQMNYIKPSSLPDNFPTTSKYRISNLYDRTNLTQQISDNPDRSVFALPNTSLNFTNGYVSKDKRINSVFNFTFRNSNSISYTERLDYFSSTEIAFRYLDTNYSRQLNTSALWNVSYDGKVKINFRNLFNYNSENYLTIRNGENYDNEQQVSSKASTTINKLIYSSQLDGNYKKFDFVIGYNFMNRNQPDYRIQPTAKSLNSSDNLTTVWRDTYRFWSSLTENTFNFSTNYSYGKFKFGISNLFKTRNFDARIFRYDNPTLLSEVTNNTDKYSANFNVLGNYLMFDDEIGKFKINAGLRFENNRFDVLTSDYSGRPLLASRNYFDLLPSINLSYNLTKKHKIRLSGGNTVARPELREVSNFAYYDFIRNAQIIGNPQLERTQILNSDLKYEWYPKSGEMISISAFYKYFNKPIEMIVDEGSVPSNLLLTYTNPDNAVVTGLEFDAKKSLTKWLSVFTNLSWIYSKVSTRPNRALQGQSPYIINTGLNFRHNSNSLSISYNKIGPRISAVGFQGYSNIYENARDVLDFVYIHKFKNSSELKVSIIDLFSQNSRFYQKDRPLDLISTRNERQLSIGYNYKF